jgi:hypothetical protein
MPITDVTRTALRKEEMVRLKTIHREKCSMQSAGIMLQHRKQLVSVKKITHITDEHVTSAVMSRNNRSPEGSGFVTQCRQCHYNETRDTKPPRSTEEQCFLLGPTRPTELILVE